MRAGETVAKYLARAAVQAPPHAPTGTADGDQDLIPVSRVGGSRAREGARKAEPSPPTLTGRCAQVTSTSAVAVNVRLPRVDRGQGTSRFRREGNCGPPGSGGNRRESAAMTTTAGARRGTLKLAVDSPVVNSPRIASYFAGAPGTGRPRQMRNPSRESE